MGRPSKGGINVVRKILADGTVKEYHYAKKAPASALGGLEFRPETTTRPDGTVIAFTRQNSRETVDGLIDLYLDGSAFRKLKPRSQFDYRRHLTKVPIDLRRMTFAMLTNKKEVLSAFGDWREEMAKTAGRQTNLAWRVINIVLNYAVARGKIDFNPLARSGIKPEPEGNRSEHVWDDSQLAAMDATASNEMRLVMWAAFWTAQRQGDLLSLRWSDYDGEVIMLKQGKTDVDVVVPVAGPLKAMLDAAPRKSPLMFVSKNGRPWNQENFRKDWNRTCRQAGVKNSYAGGVTFHDLRGTAITRMLLAGCTLVEVANVSGHGLPTKDEGSASLAKYIKREPAFARSAIAKFEAYEMNEKSIAKRAQPIDFFSKLTAKLSKNTQ